MFLVSAIKISKSLAGSDFTEWVTEGATEVLIDVVALSAVEPSSSMIIFLETRSLERILIKQKLD